MCCAPRTITVDVPEASVDTSRLAQYCAQDVQQLTMAIFASKAFVEAKKDSVDPTYGCVGQRQRDLEKYKSLDSVSEDCANQLIGDWNSASGKYESLTECTSDTECYSGTCKEAETTGGTRKCQTSMRPEHFGACLLDKFSSVPKAVFPELSNSFFLWF